MGITILKGFMYIIINSVVYITSGNSSNWYWLDNSDDDESFHRCFCKNWGSIAAGSFINAFLGIPARII